MKRCDNCSNEATVFFRVSVNGHTEEKHLCAECAALEGIPMGADPFPDAGADLFPLTSFFFPELRPLSRTRTLPEEVISPAKQPDTAPAPEKAPAPAPSLATLKAQLKRAVRREDYLKAAALRDQIRALEGGN